MTIPLKKVAKRWMKEPGFKEGYDALEDEFALASQLIEARSRAGAPRKPRLRRRWAPANRRWHAWRAAGAKPSLSRR